MSTDMELLSLHTQWMSSGMVLPLGITSLPFLTNRPFLHAVTSTHMMLLSRTTSHCYEHHLMHGMDVRWNGAAIRDHQTAIRLTSITCRHWRLTNQSLPCLLMMQWMSLIQCRHQRLPQPWCSQCPGYSAGIRDYHSHDAVNVLDTAPASEITTTMMQWMSLMQCRHQRLPQPWCSKCSWYSTGVRSPVPAIALW